MPEPVRASRINIRPDTVAPPIPCEECGHHTVRVAEIVNGDGIAKGKILICTECGRRRHGGQDGVAAPAAPTPSP